LDVRIDAGAPERDPCIRIWNNGRGIPIQVWFVDFANIMSDRQDKVPNLLI
jgi:hypothetical protein